MANEVCVFCNKSDQELAGNHKSYICKLCATELIALFSTTAKNKEEWASKKNMNKIKQTA